MGCRSWLDAGGVCLCCGRLDAPEDAIAGRLLVTCKGEQAQAPGLEARAPVSCFGD